MTSTSLEALRLVMVTGQKETHQRLVMAAVVKYPGLTASELAEIVHLGPVEIRRRLTDLKIQEMAVQGAARRSKGSVCREKTWYPRERQAVLL